jgi:hypothetical protein
MLPALWAAARLLPGVVAPFAALVVALSAWAWLAVALFRSRCPACRAPLYRGPLFDLPFRACDACGHLLDRDRVERVRQRRAG